MTKRASTVATAASPSKARKKAAAQPQVEKCLAIATALGEAKGTGLDLPDSMLDLLTSMCCASMGIYKDARHPHQDKVVQMIGKALNSIDAKNLAKVKGFEGKIENKDADKKARAQKKASAEAALSEAKTTLAQKKEELGAASAAKTQASATLKDAKKNQASGDASLNAIATEKSALEDALKMIELSALSKASLTSTSALAKHHELDSSLIQAMGGPLAKSPGDRGTFDEVIVTQLKEAFSKIIARKGSEVETGQPAKDARAAAVATATEASASAEAKETACKEACAAAETAMKEATAACRSADKDVTHWLHDLKDTMDSYDDANATAKAFQEGPLKAYSDLLNMETPPPPPVEVPAAAEPTSETAAATEAAGTAAAP